MNDSLQLYNNELSIITKPIPKVNNPDDVLIRVAYSGICGTDLHIIAGEFPSSTKALTLGHEFSGVIEKVGSSVTTFKPGDRVVVNPNNNCNKCSWCRKGNPHFCTKGRNQTAIGVWKNGGWANYCRVPENLVYHLPHQIPFRNGIFIEPISCVLRGWNQIEFVSQQARILVIGAGIIGLLWSSFLHYKGFHKMNVSEISKDRREIAKNMELGLEVFSPDQLLQQFEDGGDGFDLIIDCSGSPKAIEEAFNMTNSGATLLLFGVCPKESKININPFEVFIKELKIVGSLINPFTFEASISAVQAMERYLSYDKLGIDIFTLQDYTVALEKLKNGQVSKSVFKLDFNVE